MGTFLVFLAGILFLAGIIYIMIPKTKGSETWKQIVNWILYLAIWADLATGISFIMINASYGHEKAISTAVFLFFGSAIVLVVIWARLLGLIGGKKGKVGASNV